MVQYTNVENYRKQNLSFIDTVDSVHKRTIEEYANQKTPQTQLTWQIFDIVPNLCLNPKKDHRR